MPGALTQIMIGGEWVDLPAETEFNYEPLLDSRERIHPIPKSYRWECTFLPVANIREILDGIFRPSMEAMLKIWGEFKGGMPPNRYKKFMYRAHQRERDKRYQRRARRANPPTS